MTGKKMAAPARAAQFTTYAANGHDTSTITPDHGIIQGQAKPVVLGHVSHAGVEVRCPFCRRIHIHSGTGPRLSHCGGGNPREYLVFVSAAQLPRLVAIEKARDRLLIEARRTSRRVRHE